MKKKHYWEQVGFVVLIGMVLTISFAASSWAAEKKPVELVYASGWPKHHPQVGILAEKWMDKVKEATQGRVKMRGVYGGSLLDSEATLEGVIKRTADAGALVVSYWPGQLKMSTALASTIDLDLGNKLDMKGLVLITRKLYEDFPQFSDEYQKLGITALVWLPSPAYLLLSTKPIEKFEDLKGKKIRAFGVNMPKLQNAAGAVPVSVSTSEMYTSLQTGVIDAVMTDPPNMVANKLYESAKYFITTGPGKGALCSTCAVAYAMNNKSLGQLSKGDQEAIKKASNEISLEGAAFMTEAWEKAVEELKKNGVKVSHLSQAEIDKWAAKCPDWYALSAENLNKEGLPGTKFAERYKALARDYISGKWKP